MVQRRKITVPGLALAALLGLGSAPQPVLAASGPLDEAKLAGRDAASFPPADEDYFHGNGQWRRADARRGQGPQHVAGLDRRRRPVLGLLSERTFGAFDLLKTISSHPSLKNNRANRWTYLGLTNEPCFDQATGPDPEHFGLWLDKRRADCPPDPFANAQKYPGVAIGARGKNLPVGSYLWRADRDSGPAPVPESRNSTRRPPGTGTRSAITRTPSYYNVQGSGAAVPRRHVVRLLPCRAEPDRIRRPIPRTRNGRT